MIRPLFDPGLAGCAAGARALAWYTCAMLVRAPGPDDLHAVLDVIVARDFADLGVPDYTRADLETEWDGLGEGLARDARVAVHAGAIRGYAVVRPTDALVVVHPEATGNGLGSALLAWTEERERALGRACHRRDAAATDVAGHELLEAAGYARVRSFRRLTLDLAQRIDPAPPPAHVSLRDLDPEGDALAVHELDERAFAENADFSAQSFEDFRRRHLQAHDLDPRLSPVAVIGESLVGFALTRRWAEEDSGHVAILAVDPGCRRAGIGRALLSDAFARIAAVGLATAQLSVASDNPRALALYTSLGMTVRFQIDSFERPAG